MKSALHTLEEMAMMQEVNREKRGAFRAQMQLARPSAIHRPTVTKDGDKWCALYGVNLQEGVAGFGNTPDEACRQFDVQWLNERINLVPNAGVNSAAEGCPATERSES
jgi:hypothetical protein